MRASSSSSTLRDVGTRTPADIATYDKIADFLVPRKITTTKVDLGKVLQRGFYAAK